MENKRILVLCGGKFALPALQTLAFEKYLCAIGIGKGEKKITDALEDETERTGLPFRSFPDKVSISTLSDWIAEVQPDYIFSISFPFLIPEEALNYGKEKFINFHPGPLPAFRGPMPIFEVLRYQETETAISVHFMNQEFDEGPLILMEQLPIEDADTYGSLAVKLSERTAQVALNLAQMLEFAAVIPREEQARGGHYFEKPEPGDTFINWNRMSAKEILNLIRACNPWNQGADGILHGEQIKVVSAKISASPHNSTPGIVTDYSEEKGLTVSCINKEAIDIQIISSDHGIMTASDFVKAKKTTLWKHIEKMHLYLRSNLQGAD